MAKSKTATPTQSLEWLADIVYDPEVYKFLMELLNDADITRRRSLAEAMTRLSCKIYVYPEGLKIMFKALEDSDPLVRRLSTRHNNKNFRDIVVYLHDDEAHYAVVQKLKNLLSDSDLVLRRSAAIALSCYPYLKLVHSVQIQAPESRAKAGESVYAGAEPLAEQPGEAQAFAQIRAAAEKWLAEHQPNPRP